MQELVENMQDEMNSRGALPAAILGILTLLFGCTTGTPTILTVQLCLNDDKGVLHFKDLMRSIADSEHMTFVDGSAESQRDLKIAGAKMDKLDRSGSVINIGINQGHENVMLGGNLGLPTYQVVLGFSGIPNSLDAERFPNIVLKQLASFWRIEKLPAGASALPMKNCPGKI